MKEKIRLDKYLSDYTELTRSQAKKAIRDGRVRLDGETTGKAETKVSSDAVVFLDGREIKGEIYQYIMLHKPVGIVSATSDREETTVVEYARASAGERFLVKDLFPVGRLDKDTEGLLLLTNDGEMAHRLLSPAHHVPKKYYVVLDEALGGEDAWKIETGLDIGEKNRTKPARLEQISPKEYFLTITEGKYHQVKRMFAAVGGHVVYLKRVEMAGLALDETLAKGEWRFLTEEEVSCLKKNGKRH